MCVGTEVLFECNYSEDADAPADTHADAYAGAPGRSPRMYIIRNLMHPDFAGRISMRCKNPTCASICSSCVDPCNDCVRIRCTSEAIKCYVSCNKRASKAVSACILCCCAY